MNCKQFSEMSTDYLDGSLSLYQRLSIFMHRAMCQHCKLFLLQYATSFRIYSPQEEELSQDEIEATLESVLHDLKTQE